MNLIIFGICKSNLQKRSETIAGMSTVGKSPSKIREKESHIPGLFDSKNASSKDNPEVTFAELDLTYLEHDLSNNQNDLNTLNDKKDDPSADREG
ncbi:MAG: hypothetical protein WAM14_22190 [Candidatus Nitrosopolaris sp.]